MTGVFARVATAIPERWRFTAERCLGPAVLSLLLCWGTAGAAEPPVFSNASSVIATYATQLQDQSRPAAERLPIIKMFKEWATPQVAAPLVAVLGDPQPEIRQAAADALGFAGGPVAVKALRERVQNPSETKEVKAAALQSLGRIGDESARPLLLGAANDPDARLREAALWGLSLGKLQSPADRPMFLRQFAADRAFDTLSRCQAIQALADIKDTGATDTLIKLFESEPPAHMPLPGPSGTQQEIMVIRYQQARDVRAWTARTLGVLEARQAVPLLLKASEDPADYFLRFMSVATLASWNIPEARPALIRGLEDPFPDVRVVAILGLGKARDRSAVDPIAGRLGDESTRVRAQALSTLGELGDPKVRPKIEKVLETDPDPVVQRAAETALAQLPR